MTRRSQDALVVAAAAAQAAAAAPPCASPAKAGQHSTARYQPQETPGLLSQARLSNEASSPLATTLPATQKATSGSLLQQLQPAQAQAAHWPHCSCSQPFHHPSQYRAAEPSILSQPGGPSRSASNSSWRALQPSSATPSFNSPHLSSAGCSRYAAPPNLHTLDQMNARTSRVSRPS